MSWSNVAGQLTDQQVREQLLAALRQPFEEQGENHIGKWFETLERSIPMWSFQRLAFRQVKDLESPSASPLDQIIDSILNDETEESRGGELISVLSRRRYHLTSGIAGIETWGLSNTRAKNVIVASDSGSYWSPGLRPYMGALNAQYTGIGRRLTAIVDAIEAARGTADRTAAKQQLDDYLKEITKSRRGRPTEGPPARMLKALHWEGKILFELLWDLPKSDLDPRSASILESELPASSASSELVLWSNRLVLPVLSRPEFLALWSEVETSRTWHGPSWRPSPRYFTVWVMAHRLNLNPVTLTEKVLGSRDAEYFSYKDNPIDEFLTH